MALRHLVEGECGAANPLVQWTAHFTQEKSMLKGGLDHDRLADLSGRGDSHGAEQQMVNEFLGQPAVPQTFHMGSLLHQVQSIPQPVSSVPTTHMASSDGVAAGAHVQDWVQEFSGPTDTWVREFEQLPPAEAKQWASETSEENKWVSEFQSARHVAKEMSESVADPRIQATEFMDFVKKVASGEVTLNDKEEVAGGGWVDQFEQETNRGNGGFWSQLEKEWNDLAREESHPWLSEFENRPAGYQFQEENPLRDISHPLEEGLKKLEEGDLPTAVLLFEAEVLARPDSVLGWQYLGSTQADNEQDVAAIAALHKCLELQPNNLDALMALAVSYTNESKQTKVHTHNVCTLPALEAVLHCYQTNHPRLIVKALEALRGWIHHNPKYTDLAQRSPVPQDKPFTGSFMTREEHASVRDLYLAAAQTSPDQIDYNVQVGLGVLFNLSHEYDKAVDCFSAALDIRPNDAMLWNKLGATLANGNRSEEAVSAYRKALEIMPGFTRCRYNLGVSCINLGAHKEAVEHFLTALNIQREARGPQGSKVQMSESIWGTLRLALTFLGGHNLHKLVESKDLDGLMREFGLD